MTTSTGMKAEIEDAKGLVEHWRDLSGLATTVFALYPFAGKIPKGLMPIWPDESDSIAGVLAILSLVFCFLTQRRHSPEVLTKRSMLTLRAALLLFIIYVAVAATYVTVIDGESYLIGMIHTAEVTKAIKNQELPESPTTRDLLNHFGHESEDRIWHYRGVLKWALPLMFWAVFSCGASGFFLMLLRDCQKSTTAPTTST